jgi:glycerol-3-phosphate O-acyltransferase
MRRMRREDQHSILAAVERRVGGAVLAECLASGAPVDEVLAESVFQQRRRLKDLPKNRAGRREVQFWDGVQRRLGRADAQEQQALLAQVLSHYAQDVCGHFDERVYGLARRVLPPVLGALLTASSPKRLLTRWPDLAPLDDSVIVQGETEHLRRLHEVGTVILAPTHVSNLDSVVMAFASARLNLPPLVYGAAKDLFENPLLGFFLHNLGAYTVDRRNQDPLYKRVLKTYATVTLEHGYDNLFFPGGARSRSGAIERRLKLGLVGTALPAYIHNLQRGAPRPKLFIIPATLSYQLVLEAETLMDDFLKDIGRARYIITDDEFSRPHRVFDFISQLFGLDSKIFLTIGRGLDPFGNPVDDNGESLDPRGRRVDPSRYVLEAGVPAENPPRDFEYTRDMGDAVLACYNRDNVIQATHVTARAIFSLLRAQRPHQDWLRVIRVGGVAESFGLREVYQATARLLAVLRRLADAGALRLAPLVGHGAADDVVSDGLRHFAIYHRQPAARRRGDRVLPQNRGLLYYYQNRLDGYPLDDADGAGVAA